MMNENESIGWGTRERIPQKLASALLCFHPNPNPQDIEAIFHSAQLRTLGIENARAEFRKAIEYVL
jgi:hypothetical protein